jgi:CheY-like chemotaxis protein
MTEHDKSLNDNLPVEMVVGLARDMRVPLNSILGFSQWLATDSSRILAEDQREAVSQIMEAARELNQLIEATLTPNQAMPNVLQIKDGEVDIADVVAKSIELVTPMAVRSGIEITNNVKPGKETRARGDASRLRQLVFNLLSNAIKFNNPEGKVAVACTNSSDGMLRIEVQDTGIGIAEDRRAAIFDPLTVGVSESGGGLGMGLAIAKRLADLMNGRIGFESVEGKGSTFWVDLVPLEGSLPGLTTTDPASESGGVLPGSDSPRRILYIEDNPANIRLLEFLIARHVEFALETAISAEDGIEMACTDPPDLILMDIGLPGMDGFEALEVLRGDPRTSAIPVMAVSANAMRHDVERGQQAGFVDYLTKPIVIDDFLAAINRILPGG